MAAGGLPDAIEDHATRLVGLGLAMLTETARLCGQPELSLRVGVHSGAVAGGVIGSKRFAFDVWGDTVNVASRLEEHGVPGRVQVSDVTAKLIEGVYEVEARGPILLRGHGEMSTYLVVSRPRGEERSQMRLESLPGDPRPDPIISGPRKIGKTEEPVSGSIGVGPGNRGHLQSRPWPHR